MRDELWGYVNTDNQLICELQYDEAMDFTEGFAAVNKNGKWTFINTEAKEIATPAYDEVRSFCHGRAAICLDGLWGFIDTKGNQILAPRFDEVTDFEEGKIAFGLLDEEMYVVMPDGKVMTTEEFKQFTTNKM